MTLYYKLDESKNVLPSSLKEYEEFKQGEFPTAHFHVGDNWVNDSTRVSTVFIGIDHSFIPHAVPVVFETIVFKTDSVIYQRRYSTYIDAEAGHIEAVQWVKDGCKEEDDLDE